MQILLLFQNSLKNREPGVAWSCPLSVFYRKWKYVAKAWCTKSIVNKKTKRLQEKGQYHCYNTENSKNLEVLQRSSVLDPKPDILQKNKENWDKNHLSEMYVSSVYMQALSYGPPWLHFLLIQRRMFSLHWKIGF